jgi:hypothetical protein
MNSSLASSPAEVWANLRRLYPTYTALAREFSIENEPCLALDEAIQVPTAETIAEVEGWFSEMDQKIEIQHLRQFVQTSQQITEAVLRDLLVHHFDKKQRTGRDRDKVDFLLVQIFSAHAPENSNEAVVSLQAVGEVLAPLLGTGEFKPAGFVRELDDLFEECRQHKTLKSLFTARVIERGRQIKDSCGDAFYEPLTLAAFARFGFLMRRTFFRLMQQDLNVILDGLRELESRGVTALDCRKAQFSAEEPINRLRMICQSWKVMFQAEYSAGQPLCILVDLRTAVEQALKQSAGAIKVKTAAAVASGSADRGELEVRMASTPGNADFAGES